MNYRSFFLAAVCAASGAAVAVLGPAAAQSASGLFKSQPKTAVLNLNRVVRANEIELAALNLPSEALQSEAERFAKRLQEGIRAIQTECDCTLLVSSAVIAPHPLPDYTEALLKRLDLSPASEAKSLEKLTNAFRKDPS